MSSGPRVDGGDAAVPYMRRMLITTNAIPEGMRVSFVHGDACGNVGGGSAESLAKKVLEAAAPKAMSEVNMLVRGVLASQGCVVGCGVRKDEEVGWLLKHSQDDGLFVPGPTPSAHDSFT